MLRVALLSACVTALAACATSGSVPNRSATSGFSPGSLVKTDIDRVAEAHQQEVFAGLKLLTEKLYRRNPRERKKSGQASLEAALARVFDGRHQWDFPELEGKRGADAIQLAFREDYAGDRVLALVAGVGGMIQSAFNDKTEFFVLDDLDPQRLHNAARNVEIAVWKLSSARDARGELFLLSNEGAGPVRNLSFEREFGKIVGSLDVLSRIVADKANRTVVKMIQSLATAVFLPVK